MDKQWLYNFAARALPKPKRKESTLSAFSGSSLKRNVFQKKCTDVLHKHRCVGASITFFSLDGAMSRVLYGVAAPDTPINDDTHFRVASVSKLITALCVMKLEENSTTSIFDDIHDYLPYRLREQPISLKQLMTHTAGLHDGDSYNNLIGTGVPVTELINSENVLPSADKYDWEYSNFGAGQVACVLESMLNKSFEMIMQEYLFVPLKISASFYPQHIGKNIANSYNVLPFKEQPALDAKLRVSRSDKGWDKVNPLQHYTLSQGNCFINADGLVQIGNAFLRQGYLSTDTLERMKTPYASFGKADYRLKQGIGSFIIEDNTIAKYPLYGHQGYAYGSIFGLYIDNEHNDGMAFCSSGCSLARKYVMADINLDIMKIWQNRELWK